MFVLSSNRQLQIFQHYKEHMRLHNTPLPHFCYHMECSQRFLTQQELKDHVKKHHQPFRPQCPFTDCEKLFSSLQCLYDHEWRHYIPVPQKDELELGPNRQKKQSSEAPWKQRVKVEELWLQNRKGQRESPNHDHVDVSNPRDPWEVSKDQACDVHMSDVPDISERAVSSEPVDDSNNPTNGFEDVTIESHEKISTAHSRTSAANRKRKCQKRTPVELDPLNVKDLEDLSTLAEGIQQKIGEPLITEHKTFKPEDPSYATFVRTPFIRPPPSTYLDESVLSMRKRRDTQKKTAPWGNSNVNREVVAVKEQQVDDAAPGQKSRQRCDKCLSSFNSLEELHKHQALNTCSSLFGFDSDDESN